MIVAFRGYAALGYDIEVTGIRQRDDKVTIVALLDQHTEMSPAAVVTSAYHAVRVERRGMTQRGNLKFVLLDEVAQQVLAEIRHYVH